MGLGATPATKPSTRTQGFAGAASGDPDAPSSWGFAVSGGADPGGGVGAAGEGTGAMIVELAALRKENHALKDELRDAREEIKRLTGGDGVGGTQAAGDGGGGSVATSATTGALANSTTGSRGGVRADGDGLEDLGGGEDRGRSKHEHGGHTPRESRSRKKIDIEKARATDAVVEAVASGEQANQNKVGPGSEEPREGLDSRTMPPSERPPEAGL